MPFWRASEPGLTRSWQPRTADIEMAAYALLSLHLLGRLEEGIPIMKWLTQQRNHLGGYGSTQVRPPRLGPLGSLGGYGSKAILGSLGQLGGYSGTGSTGRVQRYWVHWEGTMVLGSLGGYDGTGFTGRV